MEFPPFNFVFHFDDSSENKIIKYYFSIVKHRTYSHVMQTGDYELYFI
jgi:hypothetical protein